MCVRVCGGRERERERERGREREREREERERGVGLQLIAGEAGAHPLLQGRGKGAVRALPFPLETWLLLVAASPAPAPSTPTAQPSSGGILTLKVGSECYVCGERWWWESPGFDIAWIWALSSSVTLGKFVKLSEPLCLHL